MPLILSLVLRRWLLFSTTRPQLQNYEGSFGSLDKGTGFIVAGNSEIIGTVERCELIKILD